MAMAVRVKAFAVAGVAAFLGAAAASAQVLNPGDYSSSPDRGYVSSTVQSAEFDVSLSRIAAGLCAAAPVKAVAVRIADDQTQAEAATQAAAAEADAAPNRVPVLNAYQSGLLAQMRQASVARCQAVYLESETDSVRQSVALQAGYAKGGALPALRRIAGRNADQARAHLAALQSLEP